MISKFFIERPVLANVIAILMVVIGFVSLYSLPVAQYPNVVPPTVSVTMTSSAEIISGVSGEHPDLAFDFALANRAKVDALVDTSGRTGYIAGLADANGIIRSPPQGA